METKPQIYLIPGLGADGRMYGPQMKIMPDAIVLENQKPLKGETLAEYSTRLAGKIDISKPFIIIGTSLGGIIAMELSRILKPEKVILIASVKHRTEMPLWMRSMKYLYLHRLVSGKVFVWFSSSNVKRLITKRDTNVAKLLIDLHRDADPEFVEWAINEVVRWEGTSDHRPDIIHLHGTREILFPYHKVSGAIAVMGGSHVMGLTQSQDVNKILLEALGSGND